MPRTTKSKPDPAEAIALLFNLASSKAAVGKLRAAAAWTRKPFVDPERELEMDVKNFLSQQRRLKEQLGLHEFALMAARLEGALLFQRKLRAWHRKP